MKNNTIVLIPNYNDAQGLKKSLHAMETDDHIDILVVDDGSTEDLINEQEILEGFKAQGSITFLYMPKNGGIIQALNYGLKYLKDKDYEYIARLDSGDICLNHRFKVQAEYLDQHPEIQVVGSHILMKDMSGNLLFKVIVPTDYKKVRKQMYVSSSTIIHPVLMFRASIMEKVPAYPTQYYCEDFAFYFELLKHYNIANIDAFLLEKELNPNSMSLKNRKKQAGARLDVLRDNFYFGFYPIYGLLRNYLLYYIPNKWLIKIKTTFLS